MGKYRHQFPIEGQDKEIRSRRRLKLFLPVTIQDGNKAERAHLLDISNGGARLHAHVPPTLKQDVTVEWSDVRVRGQVMWVKGNGFGLSFQPPINDDLVTRLIHAE